ncbi:MAG TPA: uroporphyrinogen decarboxylase [Nitrospinota bacterium]|nr:uroporphyrinogen decarboxylase [Nitrospinota bacterium]
MTTNNQFLKACRKEKTDYTPVWLMRQAGRYMEEYRKIRSKVDFLTMCKTPDLAAEVTLQPINRIGVDAAIIFADILLPLEPMGIKLEFAKNEGPVINNPIRTNEDVNALQLINTDEELPFLPETIRIVKQELNGKVPLIGFSGAPFTLASYIIEGGSSKNYIHAKKMMYNEPETWNRLMGKISDVIINYLLAQIKAGAETVQLFDSWVGCLSTEDYRQYVLPHSKKIIENIKKEINIPVIHFGTNTTTLLQSMKEAGGDVIGLDWRINLDEGWKKIGFDKAVQGNLDPLVLLSNPAEIEKRVKDILKRADGRPGHIFNLGHGILPQTPVDNVIALVEMVHNFSGK